MKLGDKQDKKVSPLTTENVKGVSRLGKSSVADTAPQTMVEVLGSIYDLLCKIQDYEKLQSELELVDYKLAYMDEQDRNKKIIEALGGKKKKKKKAKEKQQEKEIEKEKAKPETKAQPTEKAPPSTTKPEAPKPSTTKPEAPKPSATKAPPKEAPSTPTPKAETVPTPTPKPTLSTPSAARAPVTAGKGAIGTVAAGAGVIGTITAGLVAAGITNAYAQKAILANVGKETGFKPRDEDLAAYAKTSNERIREVFASRTQKYSDAELSEIKKDPVKFGEMVYGKDTKMGQSMGNTQDGDGYKYRGRGSIQLTGKNNYAAYGKVVGKDLVSNPDLVNDPAIDATIVAAFVKKGVGNKINDFTDQQSANRAVTQAIGGSKLNLDVGVGAKILSKVDEYSAALSGDKLNSASTENKNLKADAVAANQDKPAITVNNNKTSTTGSPSSGSSGGSDDTNAYQRKLKG